MDGLAEARSSHSNAPATKSTPAAPMDTNPEDAPGLTNTAQMSTNTLTEATTPVLCVHARCFNGGLPPNERCFAFREELSWMEEW
jgi:hypothetical protein